MVHLVEAAVAHGLGDLGGAGAVGVAEVGDGELALPRHGSECWARPGQPVPNPVARASGLPNLSCQADFGDAVDVAQALGALGVGVVVQASLKCGDDLGFGQARARGPRTPG